MDFEVITTFMKPDDLNKFLSDNSFIEDRYCVMFLDIGATLINTTDTDYREHMEGDDRFKIATLSDKELYNFRVSGKYRTIGNSKLSLL